MRFTFIPNTGFGHKRWLVRAYPIPVSVAAPPASGVFTPYFYLFIAGLPNV